MLIEIIKRSCDGSCKKRKFKTLKGAQRYAHAYVGERPSLGSNYAVSDDGVATVRVYGATLKDIFPEGY